MGKRVTEQEAYSRYKEKFLEVSRTSVELKKDTDMMSPQTFYDLYRGLRSEGETLRSSINTIIDSQLANSSSRVDFFINVKEKFMREIFAPEERFQELKGMKKRERSPEEQREFEKLQHQRTELINQQSPDPQYRKWLVYGDKTLKKMIQSNYNTTGDWLRWMNDVMSEQTGVEYSNVGEWYYLP